MIKAILTQLNSLETVRDRMRVRQWHTQHCAAISATAELLCGLSARTPIDSSRRLVQGRPGAWCAAWLSRVAIAIVNVSVCERVSFCVTVPSRPRCVTDHRTPSAPTLPRQVGRCATRRRHRLWSRLLRHVNSTIYTCVCVCVGVVYRHNS